ncbi:lipopolysaccharide-induced tumor necrosis factor-alpha factor homolog isoform X1 [Cydia strobilella]|uniref:lipopolysaccharide-induced tumor necrosis factor-alpha factor homolog isoform X1 n=1 Tax=Cydia strobilella TaxID=1100964 RepID=UPI0030068AC7
MMDSSSSANIPCTLSTHYGKDTSNLDEGYPTVPMQDTTPRTAPPPYTYHPQLAYPHPPQVANTGYPHPTAGYPHPQAGPTVHPTAPGATVIAGPTIIVQTVVGPESTRTTCRNCNAQISTRIDRKPTMKTHLMAALLCVLGCWCCVCVPYCMDSCLDVDHYCPNCGTFVGSYAH